MRTTVIFGKKDREKNSQIYYNVLNFNFLRMIKDIIYFYKMASKIDIGSYENQTLGDFLKSKKMSDYFINFHIIPMVAAIWSSPTELAKKMPMKLFLNFFRNHGLFKIKNRPQWYTVTGRSKVYVNKVLQSVSGEYFKNYKIKKVLRNRDNVRLYYGEDNEYFDYDHVVFAAHADQTLNLISNPTEKFDGVPLVGVYPVPTRYSYWIGDTQQNSTSMEYSLSASYYEKNKWPVVWSESQTISVPPNNTSTVDVTLIVPNDFQTGVYQGFLTFEGSEHSVNAPVSFVVMEPIIENDTTIIIKGIESDDVLYGNGYTKGAFDMSNRYMAGDWRQYYFDIQNESVDTAMIELSWKFDDTNFAVFVMDPSGKIIQTNVPSGVFGHFLEWPSLDWLCSSIFSQGGGFFPVKNKDNTSTVLYVPVNQTGTYTLLTHSTLFGGDSTTEPITLTAKFTNISSDLVNSENVFNSKSETIDSKESETIDSKESETIDSKESKIIAMSNNQTSLVSNNDPLTIAENESFSGFDIGLVLGILVGVAIGITFFLIIRQKNT